MKLGLSEKNTTLWALFRWMLLVRFLIDARSCSIGRKQKLQATPSFVTTATAGSSPCWCSSCGHDCLSSFMYFKTESNSFNSCVKQFLQELTVYCRIEYLHLASVDPIALPVFLQLQFHAFRFNTYIIKIKLYLPTAKWTTTTYQWVFLEILGTPMQRFKPGL